MIVEDHSFQGQFDVIVGCGSWNLTSTEPPPPPPAHTHTHTHTDTYIRGTFSSRVDNPLCGETTLWKKIYEISFEASSKSTKARTHTPTKQMKSWRLERNLTQSSIKKESLGQEATCRASSTLKGDPLFTWKK